KAGGKNETHAIKTKHRFLSRHLGRRHRKSTDPNGSLPQRRTVVKQPIRNVVLVHGAFADGSGWKRVADILKNDGYKVSVAQPPETSYADDHGDPVGRVRMGVDLVGPTMGRPPGMADAAYALERLLGDPPLEFLELALAAAAGPPAML